MNILIVGRGIAGSLTAWEALERGHHVTMIAGDQSSASSVAAGVCTPITGKRFALSWEYGRFYDDALATYQMFSNLFKQQLFHPIDSLRLFRSAEESTLWNSKKAWPEFLPFVKDQFPANHFDPPINDPHGSLLLTKTGWCDVPALLNHLHSYLQKRIEWICGAFDHHDIQLGNSGARWHNKNFDAIIFCEGYQITKNRYFNWFPFQLSKGEVLQLEVDSPDKILNFGYWLVPQSATKALAGSTYEWDDLNETPTAKGREEILEGLQKYFKAPVKVMTQQAGVRSAVNDMLPLCGPHPEHPALWVLNGLGAKGILRTPYLTKYLLDRLEKKQECWREVDPARYWKKI